MRRAGLSACFAIACFNDPPSASGDDERGTASSSSTDATGTMTTATSATTSATASSSPTSGPDTDDSPTTQGETGLDTTQGTADASASTTSSSNDCHVIDFDSETVGCVAELALPIGPYSVAFTNNAFAGGGPCVEDTGNEDSETAPLTARYVQLEISSNDATTLSFSAPVADVKFAMGPHHADGESSLAAICTTTAGPCENTTASADETAAAGVSVMMEGAQDLFIYQTKGVAFIGIDELEVCFE